jgi:hypothetical protein
MNLIRPLTDIGLSNCKRIATAAAMVALTGAVQAGLVINPNGTVTDTNTNLIWLQNWNINGEQDWLTQRDWAETGLDGFAGSNDWVLPSISQYADLFTAYGNLTLVPQFMNVQSGVYWSGTEFDAGRSAWLFRPDNGSQPVGLQTSRFFAVAVRPVEVTASVPEPQTLALALLALGATVVARRRRPA